jgi:hypothetical protein
MGAVASMGADYQVLALGAAMGAYSASIDRPESVERTGGFAGRFRRHLWVSSGPTSVPGRDSGSDFADGRVLGPSIE